MYILLRINEEIESSGLTQETGRARRQGRALILTSYHMSYHICEFDSTLHLIPSEGLIVSKPVTDAPWLSNLEDRRPPFSATCLQHHKSPYHTNLNPTIACQTPSACPLRTAHMHVQIGMKSINPPSYPYPYPSPTPHPHPVSHSSPARTTPQTQRTKRPLPQRQSRPSPSLQANR